MNVLTSVVEVRTGLLRILKILEAVPLMYWQDEDGGKLTGAGGRNVPGKEEKGVPAST